MKQKNIITIIEKIIKYPYLSFCHNCIWY